MPLPAIAITRALSMQGNREGRKADRRGQPSANTLSVALGPTRDFGNIGGLLFSYRKTRRF